MVVPRLDGRSRPEGTYPVAFNADSSSGIFEDVQFAFYLVPGTDSSCVKTDTKSCVEVTVANFRRVLIDGVPRQSS